MDRRGLSVQGQGQGETLHQGRRLPTGPAPGQGSSAVRVCLTSRPRALHTRYQATRCPLANTALTSLGSFLIIQSQGPKPLPRPLEPSPGILQQGEAMLSPQAGVLAGAAPPQVPQPQDPALLVLLLPRVGSLFKDKTFDFVTS